MRTPSTTASDFDSCRGGSVRARASAFRTSALFLSALLVLIGCTTAFTASTAFAAEHTTITGEYGKEGPKATGIGNSCRLAYDGVTGRIFLYSDNKIYGLQRNAPGSVT